MPSVKKGLLGSGINVAIGTFLFTIANLFRDVAFANTFGTSVLADIFFLATMIPVFIQTVVSSSYKSICIPYLGDILERNGKTSLNNFLIKLIKINLIYIVIVVVILFFSTHYLADIIAAKLDEQQKEEFVKFTWMLLPLYAMATFAMLMEGALQRRSIFFRSSFPRVFLPLGMALGAIFWGEHYGVKAVIVGGTVGSILHILFIFRVLIKEHVIEFSSKVTENIDVDFTDFRLQFFYLSMGSMIVYVSPVIDQWMASFLGEGSVSTLSYAAKLAIGVTALTVGSLSPVILTFLSNLVSKGKEEDIKEFYIIYLKLSIWVGAFVSLSMWFLSEPIISLLYEHGDFSGQDVINVANVLKWSALQVPPLLICVVGFTLISALKQNKIFIPLNIMNIVINVSGNYVLMKIYGVQGIAMATGITYLFSLVTINVYLSFKKIINIDVSVLFEIILCLLLVSVVFNIGIYFEAILSRDSNVESLIICFLLLLTFILIAAIKNYKNFMIVSKYKL